MDYGRSPRNFMIHQAINKAEVARRYYGERYNSKEQAKKQFQQDKNIDYKKVLLILKDIFSEQKQMLKSPKK